MKEAAPKRKVYQIYAPRWTDVRFRRKQVGEKKLAVVGRRIFFASNTQTDIQYPHATQMGCKEGSVLLVCPSLAYLLVWMVTVDWGIGLVLFDSHWRGGFTLWSEVECEVEVGGVCSFAAWAVTCSLNDVRSLMHEKQCSAVCAVDSCVRFLFFFKTRIFRWNILSPFQTCVGWLVGSLRHLMVLAFSLSLTDRIDSLISVNLYDSLRSTR